MAEASEFATTAWIEDPSLHGSEGTVEEANGPGTVSIVGDGRGADGVTLATSTNNWDDANAYRLGISYQLTPRTQLRFGYTLDKTGQKDGQPAVKADEFEIEEPLQPVD